MRNIKIELLLSMLALAVHATAHTALERLTIEGRISPIGLDVEAPRFGWTITSDEKNVVQKAYRIMVGTQENGPADVWDSGVVENDSSQWVAYKGKALKPNSRYYWRVMVKTNRGKASWSQSASWTTGLLRQDNWKGLWIGLDSLVDGDKLERHSRVVPRCMRKAFDCKGTVKRATMHISGLGLYTLYINSKRVGHGTMTPVGTEYDKTVAYDTYDVTALLGEHNAIGVTLAGGHYFAQTQNYQKGTRKTYGMPKLRANLIVEYADGHNETIASDATWTVTTDGPVRYANEYDGELYDARNEMDFSSPRFDDSRWIKAHAVAAPKGLLRGNITPPMTVYATESPKSMARHGKRVVVDFGTNGAGRVKIDVEAHDGDTVRVRHAELLEPGDTTLYTKNLRSAEATAWLVGNGKRMTWAPQFTFYGFRYAEITLPEGATIASVARELIADEMDGNGDSIAFDGGDGANMLNTIMDNAYRGIRSNYKGMPIDCPQRDERMPWLGDRTTGCTGESYVLDNHALYSKWLGDIRDSQLDDGGISDVSPAYWRLYRTNVTWPAALPFGADMLYKQYGDIRPMRDSYDAISKWLRLVKKSIWKDGLVTYDRYGDWCVPPERQDLVHSKDPARKTDGTLLSSTYYYYLCRMMQRYALMFEKDSDAQYFENEANATREAVNKTFLRNATYSNGTVTANLLPLAMDMVPDTVRNKVEQALMHTIEVTNKGHVSCGVVGIQWLMRYLSDSGHGNAAFNMATTKAYPGWGYMVDKGATTIWELWNGDTANPSMNSGNHVMLLGDLIPWCYERLGGIRPSANKPGFKHVVMQPDFSVEGLSGVSAAHRSPYGQITSQWSRQDGKVTWRVKLPANTTAELHLPNGKVKKVGSGEHEITFKAPRR